MKRANTYRIKLCHSHLWGLITYEGWWTDYEGRVCEHSDAQHLVDSFMRHHAELFHNWKQVQWPPKIEPPEFPY